MDAVLEVKENVAPARRGRDVARLACALAPRDAAACAQLAEARA
jgi:hypothetical protein